MQAVTTTLLIHKTGLEHCFVRPEWWIIWIDRGLVEIVLTMDQYKGGKTLGSEID